MKNSVDTTMKLINVGSTYKELEAICIGYEGNNKELFDYYNDMKKWLSAIYIFIQSEAQTIHNLQQEIWEIENAKRDARMKEFEAKREVDILDTPPVSEKKWIEKMWFKQKYFVFKIFGYSFSIILEVAKK